MTSSHQEKQILSNEILDIIRKEADSDENIFFIIFKVLTDNGERKNYSSNKNGVFFNMMAIQTETLVFLRKTLEDYIKNKQNSVKYEISRTDTISMIQNEVYHPRDSSSFLKETMKEHILSTSIKDPESLTVQDNLRENNSVDDTETKKYKNGNYKKGIYCEKRLKAFKDDGGLSCLSIKEKPLKGVYSRLWKSMYSNAQNNNTRGSSKEEISRKTRSNSIVSDEEIQSDYDIPYEEIQEQDDASSVVSYENAPDEDDQAYDKDLELELFGEDSDMEIDTAELETK